MAEASVVTSNTGAAHAHLPASCTTERTEFDFATHTNSGGLGTWVDRGDAAFRIVDVSAGAPDNIADPMASQFTRLTTKTGRARYSPTQTVGTAPIQVYHTIAGGTEEAYFDFDFAVGDPWKNHDNSNLCKQLFLTGQTQNGSGGNPLYTGFRSAAGTGGLGALVYAIFLQGCVPNKGGNSASGDRSIITTGAIVRGTKYRGELYVKLNTVDGSSNGVADGIVKFWLDTVLLANVTNACFRGADSNNFMGPAAQLTTLYWTPTYGGAGGNPPGQVQFQYMGYGSLWTP